MTRTYQRTSSKGNTHPDVMKRGVEEVLFNGKSIRSVALDYDICHVTLMRYVNVKKSNRDINRVGYIGNRQVFTDAQEFELEKYITAGANIYFGLSPKEVRKIAYQCALAFNIRIPDSWHMSESAGPDWFSNFLRRHPSLSIRTPEATSLSRATSFNRQNVNQ